jgi:TetR/AcrR family transcriptional regulator
MGDDAAGEIRVAASEPDTGQTDTSRKIFEAALNVFSCKGHDGARMKEIADLAGINRALLHYYFNTKRELYEAVFAHLFQQYMNSFRTVLNPEEPFADSLRHFIGHYIDYVRGHMDMARLVIHDNLSGGTLLGEHLARAFATHGSPQQRFEEAIVRAAERGEIRPVDPKQTILTVISACVLFLITAPTVKLTNPDAGADFDAFVEARKEHVFNVVYHGIEARGGDA